MGSGGVPVTIGMLAARVVRSDPGPCAEGASAVAAVVGLCCLRGAASAADSLGAGYTRRWLMFGHPESTPTR